MITPQSEYCLPFDNENSEFWMRIEHLGRYLFAADCARRYMAGRVLDVACANGYGCFEMASAVKTAYGIDYNEELIGNARHQASQTGTDNVHFFCDDLNRIKLADIIGKTIDMVTCFDTLEHLADPVAFVQNIADVLRFHGFLLLSVPKKELEPVNRHGKPKNKYHLHRFTETEINELLKENGFEIIRRLGQPYTNINMKLANNVCRDTGISKQEVMSHYSQTKEGLRMFARMYGLPTLDLPEYSYNTVIIAQKKRA